MAERPDDPRMMPERIVAIATFYGVLGTSGLLLGLGPQLQAVDPRTQVVGVVAMGAGTTLIIAAVALVRRAHYGRWLGLAGAVAAAILGLLVVGLALASRDSCSAPRSQGEQCYALLSAVGLGGLVIMGGAVAAIIALCRLRESFFRG